jgi:hypothetical protein
MALVSLSCSGVEGLRDRLTPLPLLLLGLLLRLLLLLRLRLLRERTLITRGLLLRLLLLLTDRGDLLTLLDRPLLLLRLLLWLLLLLRLLVLLLLLLRLSWIIERLIGPLTSWSGDIKEAEAGGGGTSSNPRLRRLLWKSSGDADCGGAVAPDG